MGPALQGQVQHTEYLPFEEVQAQPEYQAAPDFQKAQAAMEYFDQVVATQNAYKAAKPEQQQQARQEFFQQYRVPTITAAHGGLKEPGNQVEPVKVQGQSFDELPFFSPEYGKPDQLSGYFDAAGMALGGITGPAHDLVNPFDRTAFERLTEGYKQQYQGIENDEGILGKAYDFRTNHYTNLLGQGLGAFGMVRNIAAQLPEQTLGKLPYIGKLSNDARNAIAATGLFSGYTNTADVLHGKQTPIEGVGNTALDVVTAPLGGSSRVRNAVIQAASGGVSGAASSALSDTTHGQAVDWKKMVRTAMEQAAIGAGMGAALPNTPKQPVKLPRRHPNVARRASQDMTVRQANTITEHSKAANRQVAQDLHDLLHSDNPAEVVRGKELKAQLQEAAKDKKYRSGKVKEAGSQRAREILAHAEIIKKQSSSQQQKQATPSKSKATIDDAVAVGIRMRKPVETGYSDHKSTGELKARFDNWLNRNFNPEDRRIINARIGTALKNKTAADSAQNSKVADRTKRRKAKDDARRKEMAKKAQDELKARIKAENDALKTEQDKQSADEKAGKLRANMPKVLTPEQIELQAEQLHQHHQKGEKGTLEAKISKYRSAAKTDYSKTGAVDKSRSDAINETHARVLDRYAQKKAESDAASSTRKRPENVVKARAENLKELEDTKKAGGDYDFNTGTGKQKPVKPSQFKWADVRNTIDDPELQAWGDEIDRAMKEDGVIRVRYDAERSGDTGEFEYKELAPIDWGFNFTKDAEGNPSGTKVVFHAVNKNGHTGEYYLQPSDPNPKTGTISSVLEAPVRIQGKTAPRNTDPNVYKGPRAFKIDDIMKRPPRRNQGLTSETQAKLIEARDILNRYDAGESLSVKGVNKATRNVKKAQREQQGQKTAKAAEGLNKAASKSKSIRASLESENVSPTDLRKMSQEIEQTPNQKPIDEASDC